MESNANINNVPKGAELMKKIFFWEKDRIVSFKKWPFDNNSICNTTKMAQAGFYWCGNDIDIDTAACFLCDKHLDGWEQDDDPWDEHHKHAPQCVFVKIRKAEADLTVDELLTIFEASSKANLERKYNAERKKTKDWLEEQRKELIKAMGR